MKEWIQVFKAGKHTDSSGATREYTLKDLDYIVNRYNNQSVEDKHEAPAVIGHPQHDKPAYAWVAALERVGNVLYAKLKDISDGLKELLEQRAFTKISIALYPDMLLRHVGFLGAMPPAVKGLKSPEFNDGNYAEYNFEIREIKRVAEQEQAAREVELNLDVIIEASELTEQSVKPTKRKKSNNAAAGDIPVKFNETKSIPIVNFNNYNKGTEMDEFIKAVTEELRKYFNEEVASKALEIMLSKKPVEKKFNDDEKILSDLSELKAQLIEKEKAMQLQDKQFHDRLAQQQHEIEQMQFKEFFDKKVREGKVVPSQRAFIQKMYFMVKGDDETIEYSDGGSSKTAKGIDILNAFFNTLEKKVEFADVANKEMAGDDFSILMKSASNYGGK